MHIAIFDCVQKILGINGVKLNYKPHCQRKSLGWMYGRGTNKEGGVGVGEEEGATAARINIKKNGAAAVKNDVGPATVGREGIGGALMSPKARTKMANTVHARG